MFFFPQEQRKTGFQIIKTPSPAQYQPYNKSKIQQGYAPFNTTSKLNRKIKQKQQPKQQYDTIKDQQRILLTDEIRHKLLQQVKTSYMFNSKSSRFMKQQQQQNPGPGSYQLREKPGKKIRKFKQMSKSQTFLSNSRIANPGKINVPSIPFDNLGYKEDQNNHIQKVVIQNQGAVGPGAYQVSKSLLKSQGVRWQNTISKMNKQDGGTTPGPGDYNLMQKSKSQPKFSSTFNSATDRFGALKKIRKQYLPGPGDYNPLNKVKINHSISEKHFNSKAPRFKNLNQHQPDPTTYFAKKASSSLYGKNKTLVSFNTTSKQTTVFDNKNKTPGPGAYKNIYAIDHQIQKMMMRKYADSVFNNQQRIVFNNQKQQYEQPSPGPGTYEVQKPKTHKPGKLNYNRVQVVNLKEQEFQDTPAPSDTYFKNFTIQNKINEQANKLTLTQRKPFNSGSQRFKHYTKSKEKLSTKMSDSRETGNPQITQFGSTNKKVKKLVMTTVKVKVPFGMSSNKYDQKDKNMPGPGSYMVDGKWYKKSFNIKGKLQQSRMK